MIFLIKNMSFLCLKNVSKFLFEYLQRSYNAKTYGTIGLVI